MVRETPGDGVRVDLSDLSSISVMKKCQNIVLNNSILVDWEISGDYLGPKYSLHPYFPSKQTNHQQPFSKPPTKLSHPNQNERNSNETTIERPQYFSNTSKTPPSSWLNQRLPLPTIPHPPSHHIITVSKISIHYHKIANKILFLTLCWYQTQMLLSTANHYQRMRRASIDNINSKYRGTAAAHHIPTTYGVVGGPAYGTTYGSTVIAAGGVRNPTIVGGALRRSQVLAPAVYETVEHPPVYETVTTPGRVYEIVTPIVEITPDVQPQPKYLPQRPQSGCPWWCWLIFCLLFTLLLLGLLGWFFSEQIITKDPEDTTTTTTTNTNTTTSTNTDSNTTPAPAPDTTTTTTANTTTTTTTNGENPAPTPTTENPAPPADSNAPAPSENTENTPQAPEAAATHRHRHYLRSHLRIKYD